MVLKGIVVLNWYSFLMREIAMSSMANLWNSGGLSQN